MTTTALLGTCLLVTNLLFAAGQTDVRACYYGDWASGRQSPAGLSVSGIDPHLCTHLIVSFIRVAGDYKLSYYYGSQSVILDNASKLKQQNSALKVLVAVGGWNHGGHPFLVMARAVNGTTIFADSAVELLNKHNLDGLDVDWEYPQGNQKEFSDVIRALRVAFDAENVRSGKLLQLTAAVTANKHTAPYMYEYPVLASTLDYVFVMSYDLRGHWGTTTGHQSALLGDRDNFDVSSAALHYFDKGIPKSKIVMGFPTYGRSFLLRDQENNQVGAAAVSGNGPSGYYTREGGYLAYYEICAHYLATGGTYMWDDANKASYMYKNYTWVSFDSKQASCHKLRWLQTNGYRGWMVWAVDIDDHANMCSEGRYPLMTYMKDNVGKVLSESDCNSADLKPNPVANPNIPTVAPVTPPNPGGTGSPPPSGFCSDKSDGLYININDCSRFIQCHGGVTYDKPCPTGLVYNDVAKACDWPANVDCDRTKTTKPPAKTTTTATPTTTTTTPTTTTTTPTTTTTTPTTTTTTPTTTTTTPTTTTTTPTTTTTTPTTTTTTPTTTTTTPTTTTTTPTTTTTTPTTTTTTPTTTTTTPTTTTPTTTTTINAKTSTTIKTTPTTTTTTPTTTTTTPTTTTTTPTTTTTTPTTTTTTPTTTTTTPTTTTTTPTTTTTTPTTTTTTPTTTTTTPTTTTTTPTTTTTTPTTTTTTPTTTMTPTASTTTTLTSAPPVDSTTTRPIFQSDFCSDKADGYYANVRDGCKSFYRCVSSSTLNFTCPSGLLFNDASDSCDWPNSVTCVESVPTTQTTDESSTTTTTTTPTTTTTTPTTTTTTPTTTTTTPTTTTTTPTTTTTTPTTTTTTPTTTTTTPTTTTTTPTTTTTTPTTTTTTPTTTTTTPTTTTTTPTTTTTTPTTTTTTPTTTTTTPTTTTTTPTTTTTTPTTTTTTPTTTTTTPTTTTTTPTTTTTTPTTTTTTPTTTTTTPTTTTTTPRTTTNTPTTTTTTPTTTTPTTTTTTPTTTTTTPTTTTTTPTTTTTTPTTTTTTPTTTTTTPTTTTTTPTTTTTTPTTTTTTPTTTTTTPTTTTTGGNVDFECNRIMDIAIAFDSSSYVTRGNFERAKEYMIHTLSFFTNINRLGTRISLYTFSIRPHRFSYFNEHYAWEDIRPVIDGAPYYGGVPNQLRVLKKLYKYAFTTANGMRDASVPKVSVIFTDRAIPEFRDRIEKWAALLKTKSTIFTVAMWPDMSNYIHSVLPTKSDYRKTLFPEMIEAFSSPRDMARLLCNV